MQTAIQSATFHGQQLSIIDHDSRKWLTAEQVGQALGYSGDRARDSINTLYKRHDDEFSESDTCTINLMSQGQRRTTRIFSDTGCIKLGFFANTPRAKEFRTWASRALAGRETAVSPAPTFDPVAFDQAGKALIGMVQTLLPQHSLRQSYLIANAHIKATTGHDVLSIWPVVLSELDDMPPMLPGRNSGASLASLPALPWSKAKKLAGKSRHEKQIERLARYLRNAKHLPVPKQASRFTAEVIANLLGQGYIPRQILLKVMHVQAAEFNLLIAEGKEAGIVRELDGIKFNYAGAVYVAGGAA